MCTIEDVNNFLINHGEPNTDKFQERVNQYGAILDLDGKVIAASEGFVLLPETYEKEIENEEGNKQTVEINEVKSLLDTLANKSDTSLPGGIRILNKKYLFLNYDEEKGILNIKTFGGGASVGKTSTAIVIAVWNKARNIRKKNGDEKPQNPGDCERSVEELVNFLKKNNK